MSDWPVSGDVLRGSGERCSRASTLARRGSLVSLGSASVARGKEVHESVHPSASDRDDKGSSPSFISLPSTALSRRQIRRQQRHCSWSTPHKLAKKRRAPSTPELL